MKKIVSLLCSLLFVVLLVGGCSCKKDSKASLGVGDMNATTYETISMTTLSEKIKNDDSFVIYVYSDSCRGCQNFKPILENVISERHLKIYAIKISDIEEGHELLDLSFTPILAVYNKGDIIANVNEINNSEYFKNYDGFRSFLNKYTNEPTMYYISLEQLRSKISNDESFIIYYSRSDCGDCAYLNMNYLKEYLNANYKSKKFYVIETTAEGIRLNNGEVDSAQWQAIKDEFGLSEAGNSTFGYGVGYVPTFQYYNKGNLADMVVYANDQTSNSTGEDGATYYEIIDSYYSDNPHIGKTIAATSYHDTIAPFYNGKLKTFLDQNLKVVD